MPMQALVIAHASYGHNSFFKGNYLFPHLDAARRDHRLPAVREAVHHRVRAALRRGGGRARARRLPRARQFRRRPLQASREALARAGAAAPQGARGASAAAGERAVAHPAPPRGAGERARGGTLPVRAAGEPALLPREARAAARALAARDGAHRAQARTVLLPAAPDPGDERGLGDVLALHDHADAVRRGPARRQRSCSRCCTRTPTC